jgi:arginyl-tRNA synthetase
MNRIKREDISPALLFNVKKMFEIEQKEISQKIQNICIQMDLGLYEPKWVWIPFSGQWGIATSFFELAARKAKNDSSINVNIFSEQIAEQVKERLGNLVGIQMVKAVKGYLNLYFDTNLFAVKIVNQILQLGSDFGRGNATHQKVMVEFSQPNSLKAFHVGHLRNMVLGDAISNILETAGDNVIRANYMGDIGLHVITWLWNYQKFHSGEEPPAQNKIRWMGDLYAEATKRREESSENESEVRTLFKLWNTKDKDVLKLWQKTRDWSLKAFDQIYTQLDISFDHVYYESEVEDAGKILIDNLIKKGLAIDERPAGSVFVDLDQLMGTTEIYRVLVLLRSDGTSLYSTKDIPLAIKKFTQYHLDRSIYVVDVRQSLYFKQIFKILELMGYSWAGNCHHLAYEIVNLPGNVTIASREGTVILLEDLIREAVQRALKIVEQKNPDLTTDQKNGAANSVALGAIKYSLLSRDNTKIITFDWDSALNVNGQAAPYIQYAGVRANSILRKVSNKIPVPQEIGVELTKQEIQLVDYLTRLPQEIQRAAKEMKPLLITNYAYDVARAFNDFYSACPVLQAPNTIRDFRLRLVAATRQTIINSLKLLGISLPEVM